ncbi:MAG: hypothetical protein JWM86_2466 [Thermoleophilia bacterium]|nr:hypothetical protein [Thermoleophilia bacterium]
MRIRTRTTLLFLLPILAIGGAGTAVIVQQRAHDETDGASKATKIECPKRPGFTASKAEIDRVEACIASQQVQQMLRAAGATNARVTVKYEDSERLLGPARVMHVIARVDLPGPVAREFDAKGAALAIGRTIGTDPSEVILVDDQFRSLGSAGAGATR